jgi:uncharacterized protein YndB with AHSA1/START domain
MTAGTVRFHRVLRAPPARVYRAFLDAAALAKGLPPHGYAARVRHLDARVGGTFRIAFTNLATGHAHSFGGRYLELAEGARIVHTDAFDDPNLPGEMTVPVDLVPVAMGTDLSISRSGIPAAIPLEACHLGWQESLALLAWLVEAQAPG